MRKKFKNSVIKVLLKDIGHITGKKHDFLDWRQNTILFLTKYSQTYFNQYFFNEYYDGNHPPR